MKEVVRTLRIVMWALAPMALCACLWGCAQPTGEAQGESKPAVSAEEAPKEKKLEKKALNDYTWDELSEISALIAKESDEAAQREVAKKYGIVEEDGSLTRQKKQILLDEKLALDVRVAGICHDERADGKGKAGLTFMTVGGLALLPMNDVATVEGGWEACTLRGKLATEQKPRLPKELAEKIVPVRKLTNNVGISDSFESITETDDELWLFSVHEVCGDVAWDIEEFHGRRGSEDVDGMLNAEGVQYETFVQEGVTGETDPNGFLSLANSTGPSAWWYRTPYPFEWVYSETGVNGFFYQVMASGFPQALDSPEVPAAVVVGFCV